MHTQNEHAKKPSATKAGPGRYHKEGHQKTSPYTGPVGTTSAFRLHQASAAKRERKLLIKTVGKRVANRFLRMERRLERRAQNAGVEQ